MKILFSLLLTIFLFFKFQKQNANPAQEKLMHEENITCTTLDTCVVHDVKDPASFKKCDFYGTITNRIRNLAANGKIKVYDNLSSKIPLTIEEVKYRIKPRTLTIQQQDKVTGEIKDVLVPDSITVDEIRFIEDWTFDPEKAKITKKLLGYGLYYAAMDTTQVDKDLKCFFWVKNQ